MSEKNEPSADREIVLSRVFDAPRELVWRAWTEPEHLARWWGPDGFTTTIEVMDVRPGGEWNYVMHGPDGSHYPNHSLFQEIAKPERIRFINAGHKVGGLESRFESTWTFTEKAGDRTEVTIRMVFESAAVRDRVAKDFGAVEGGKQTLVRLGEHLHAEKAATTFDASREIRAGIGEVFAAFDPERLARWWGPAGFTNTFQVCEFKEGGRWSFVMHGPDGHDYPSENVFEKIVPPTKVVVTHASMPKYRLTIALAPSPAGTTVSWSQAFESAKVAAGLKPIVVPANEQNLDRLAAEVLRRLDLPG